MAKPDLSILLPEDWNYDVLEDGRIVYFKHEKSKAHTALLQWIPPLDTWKSINEIVTKEFNSTPLPYGFEKAHDIAGNLYYLSHTTQQTFRELPNVDTLDTRIKRSRKFKEVVISRHPLVGYGFMLSANPPMFVNYVVPGGPADGKLFQGDLLYCVHGSDLTVHAGSNDFFEVLETSLDTHLLQIYVVPKPRPRSKRRPPPLPPQPQKVKVRFNDPLCEVMCEDDGSFIRILAATGSEHVLRVNNELTFNDVITALKHKLHFNCPARSFGIVATRHTNRIPLPTELLVNQSSFQFTDGWKFQLRIRIIPLSLDELLVRCPPSLSYLYSQTCNDITSGFLIPDFFSLPELLAIRIWVECLRSYPDRSKPKRPSFKSVSKLGGFERFLPKMWLEHSTARSRKDLYKKIFSHLSPSNLPFDEISTMLLFLKKCCQNIAAFGGVIFHSQVQFLNKVTRICVSQSLGVAEEKVLMNNIKSAPEYTTLIDFCELNKVYVTQFSRRDNLSKVRVCCISNKEIIFVMQLYDGCEFGKILQYYYKQRISNTDILIDRISASLKKKSKCTRSLPTILVDQSLPCVKSTQDTPIYRSIHLVEPQFWSYSDHSTSFSILRQFNISKGCYFCPSRTGGTSSHVRESFIDLNEKIQIGLHGDISFTDSFDEITDSESEEYTLEVPTQFLKESIEKIHSLIPDHQDDIDNNESHGSPVNLYSEELSTKHTVWEPGKSFNYSTALNTPTGISQPPLFGGVDESLERLTVMKRTLPSPIVSGDMNIISSFTSFCIPQRTSDRTLKSRSDTILITTDWHSKYEHLHTRNVCSKPNIFSHPSRNFCQNTLVADQFTHSSVDLTSNKSKTTCVDLRSSSFPHIHLFSLNTDIYIDTDANNSICDSFHSLKSSFDENSSQNLSEIDDIFIRPPPHDPITANIPSTQNNIDPMTVHIQVLPINTISPYLSAPFKQFSLGHNVGFSKVPYQPVASKRNKCGNLSDESISDQDISKTVTLSTQDSPNCSMPPRALPRHVKRCEVGGILCDLNFDGFEISNQNKFDSPSGQILVEDDCRNFPRRENVESSNILNSEEVNSSNSNLIKFESQGDTQLNLIPQAIKTAFGEFFIAEFEANEKKLTNIPPENMLEDISKRFVSSDIEKCGVNSPMTISNISNQLDKPSIVNARSDIENITSSTLPIDINSLILMSNQTDQPQENDSTVSHTSLTIPVLNHPNSDQMQQIYELDGYLKKSVSSESDNNFFEKTKRYCRESCNITQRYSHEQNNLIKYPFPLCEEKSSQRQCLLQEESIHLEASNDLAEAFENELIDPLHLLNSSDIFVQRIFGKENSLDSESLLRGRAKSHLRTKNHNLFLMNMHPGNEGIRSARSIELIDHYPLYELPYPPTPISNISSSTKSNFAINPTCNSQENIVNCIIDQIPPPNTFYCTS